MAVDDVVVSDGYARPLAAIAADIGFDPVDSSDLGTGDSLDPMTIVIRSGRAPRSRP
jgi:hypothetical protein